MQLIITQKHNK